MRPYISVSKMKTFRTTVLILQLLFAAGAGAQDVCEIDDNQVLIFGLAHEGVYVLGLEWLHDAGGSPDRYRANIRDYPVVGWLEFVNDVLVGCEYDFEIGTGPEHTWSQAYFQVKSLLSEKYGPPTNRLEYLTGKYRGASLQGEEADRAISRGMGYYRSMWDFGGGPRSMTLRLFSQEGSLRLVYRHFRSGKPAQQDYLFP